MSSEIAIKVDNISKCYHIYDKPHDRLKQMLFRGRKLFYREFWAIKDVSFEIGKGETVGIIGRNGCGKSTLLQMICGTLNPTSGSIQTNGRIAALLELGSGFNPEFTGRENIYLSGAVLGLSKEEIDIRFHEISQFADIGDFIEQPIKTYSSGMVVRLAFAVIAHVDADILVIDEALSVGDAFFVQKCMRFLRNFMESGTVLFVSHDIGAVVNLCNRAIFLNSGQTIATGDPKEVTEMYLESLCMDDKSDFDLSGSIDSVESISSAHSEYSDMRKDLIDASNLRNDIEIFELDINQTGFGVGGARILSVLLRNDKGAPLSWAIGGENVVLEIKSKVNIELADPIMGFQFKDRLGQIIFGDNTYLAYLYKPLVVIEGSYLIAKFEFRLPILPTGDYSISCAIGCGTQDEHIQHHWIHDALILRVHASSICHGLVGVPMRKIELKIEGCD